MSPRRPDILWIVTTQWRAMAVGHAGDVNARTPRLDRLAEQSTRYLQAVTPHPFGPFARAAMLTGRPSPENGVRDYFDPLPGDARTIAHALGQAGYATAFFGKWHLSARDRSQPLVGEPHAKIVVAPERRGGFEFWEGFESGFQLNDPWLHGTRIARPERMSGYQSDVLCRRAAEWLAQKQSESGSSRAEEAQPWFAVVSLEPPHPPYDAPAAGVTPGEPDKIVLAPNVPRGGPIEARARRELAGYYAHIEATDGAIGGLLERVDDASRRSGRELPVVVFTSVHGDMHGAHGHFRKGWPYEESVRVPLLVRTPRESSGDATKSVSGRPVSILELPAMTLSWAGVGRAPIPQEACRISMPSVVSLPDQCDRSWRGVRTETRKLILNEAGEPWLFFELDRDPGEQTNLALEPGRRLEIESLRRKAETGGLTNCI